ncbi:MAG: hypothetical protein IJI57_10230 [Flexilinea sp.]|nr:hypothetical protein [Flexilinea sp.]
MCITEYDQVRTMNMFKEEGLEEGIEIGQFKALANLAEKKIITVEQAAEEAGISPNWSPL